MRGIAAFAVALAHAFNNVQPDDPLLPRIVGILSVTPLRVMLDGRDVVIFFFVLSGVILTRSLSHGRSPGFATFAFRRAIRLCLPAAAALLLSAMLWCVFYTGTPWPDPKPWFALAGWTRPPSLVDLSLQMLLIGADGAFDLDGVLWSLVHELRLSVLLPLIIMIGARVDRHGGGLLLVCAAMLFGLELGDHNLAGDFATIAWITRLLIAIVPAAVILSIATWSGSGRALISCVPGRATSWRVPIVCLVVAGILLRASIAGHTRLMLGHDIPESFLVTLYFAPSLFAGAAVAMGALDRFTPTHVQRRSCMFGILLLLCYDNSLATVAASILLISLAQQPGRLRATLRTPILAFLGRVSFSLYLVHVPLYLALGHLLRDVLPRGAIVISGVIITIPAAWILHQITERPAQALARWVGRPRVVELA